GDGVVAVLLPRQQRVEPANRAVGGGAGGVFGRLGEANLADTALRVPERIAVIGFEDDYPLSGAHDQSAPSPGAFPFDAIVFLPGDCRPMAGLAFLRPRRNEPR